MASENVSYPFKLYGATELKALEQSITDKVNRWLGDWANNNSGLQSVEINPDDNVISMATDLYSAQYAGASAANLILAIDQQLYSGFPEILLTMQSGAGNKDTALVKEILNMAFFDLIKPMLSHLSSEKIELKTLGKDESVDFKIPRASGDVAVKLVFLQGCVYLKLPYMVAKKISGFKATSSNTDIKLSRRQDCEINGALKLSVNVGGADVDFGSVLDMQAGDVIRLDSKISDLMTVTTDDGEFVCNAYLGKQDESKAIKVKF